jgi:tetratricopeptide (TPR) repeat protein
MEGDRTRRAALLLEHNRPAEAEKELRAHLAQAPHDVHALLLLSHSLTVQDKDKEAVEVAKQAVATAPDLDATHYHLAKALLGRGELAPALASAEQAIALDPGDANNHGLLALILHHANEHDKALRAAEQGLALDPEHLGCMNVRSAELTHLKRHEEAGASIDKALELDPENPYTHSNTGWTALHRGDHAKAMEHFREALRREPGLETARRGMVEALKARYWIYRQWLKYVFWVSNLKDGTQRFFIIGAWVLSRVLRVVAKQVPALELFVWPLLIMYALFAMSTWVIEPLTNLLLRFNRFGRYVLSREEKVTSTLTGLALLIAIVSGAALVILKDERFIAPGIYGLLMMIPLASMLRGPRERKRNLRVIAACVLAIVGAMGTVLALYSGEAFNVPLLVFLVGAVLYQWIVALIAR